jgi:hypothetical protein
MLQLPPLHKGTLSILLSPESARRADQGIVDASIKLSLVGGFYPTSLRFPPTHQAQLSELFFARCPYQA